jgi:hypothetical protein
MKPRAIAKSISATRILFVSNAVKPFVLCRLQFHPYPCPGALLHIASKFRLKEFVPIAVKTKMKHNLYKSILIFLLLAGTLSLTTGIDQYVHTLVCHHTTHCNTESHGLQLSAHHESDQHSCSLCQFFACGYYQSLSCDSFNIAIPPAPALWETTADTSMPAAAVVLGKISRAPPVI